MIIQIIDSKFIPSRIGTMEYYSVLFHCFNDQQYYRSYIYPKFRNFHRWKNIDVVGTVYSGARLRDNGNGKKIIDADSIITYQGNLPLPEIKKRNTKQLGLFG